MNTSLLRPHTNGLVILWNRFQCWRAMRMLSRIPIESARLEAEFAKARELLRRHAEDPQQAFKFGGDD